MLQLLGEIFTPSGEQRALAVDSVNDWLGAFDDMEVRVVSQILVWLVREERHGGAREAELHALAEMGEAGLLHPLLLAQLREASLEGLTGSMLEDYEYLASLTGRHQAN